MASSVIEEARQLHEEQELIKRAVVDEFVQHKPKSHKGQLVQQHRLREALLQIAKNNRKLDAIYKDEDGAMRDELENMLSEDVYTMFYDRVRQIREYYRRFPSAAVSIPANPLALPAHAATTTDEGGADHQQQQQAPARVLPVHFSGEEKYGQFVDMNELHSRYVNLGSLHRGSRRPEYIEYLKTFADFSTVKTELKDDEYVKYLEQLLHYLSSFHERIHPLYPSSKIKEQIAADFERRIEDGSLQYAPECFCEPCHKQFSKLSVFEGHIKGKKHAKKADAWRLKLAKNEVTTLKDITLLEESISVFRDLLEEIVDATISRVEAQQSRTYEEIEADRNELSEDDYDEDEDEDEEEEILYNPKNVPLGWDGKPIPYWLYKLHGLNIEFPCEICGNYSYWGPRAFDRHFTEWRHVNGLKSLGIQNSHDFKNVTKIEDAITLQRKVANLAKTRVWQPEEDEEFEDAQGNVFKKKTFDDLKRQGLL